MTRPRRTTRFRLSPKSICSAVGQPCLGFGALGWHVPMLFRHGCVCDLHEPPSFPFNSRSYGTLLCGFQRDYSTEDDTATYSIHRRVGGQHMGRIGVRIRSYSACVQSAGIACISLVLL